MKYLKLSPHSFITIIIMKMNMRIISKTYLYSNRSFVFMQISRSKLHNYFLKAICISAFHFISIPTLIVSIKINKTAHSRLINHSIYFFAYLLFVCKLEGQNVEIIFDNYGFRNQHTQIVLKKSSCTLQFQIIHPV